MKKVLGFLCAMLLVFGVVGSAHAVLFELNSYDVTLNDQDPGLVVNWSPILPMPTQGNLSLCQPVTVELFSLWTDETSINKDDLAFDDISVAFDFTIPAPPFSGTVSGQTHGWKKLFGIFQGGKVEWDSPETLYFGPLGDGELTISLSDECFNSGFLGVCEGECFGAVVEATFHMTHEASPVPEPTTMLLLGSGLIGIAGFRKKLRKR